MVGNIQGSRYIIHACMNIYLFYRDDPLNRIGLKHTPAEYKYVGIICRIQYPYIRIYLYFLQKRKAIIKNGVKGQFQSELSLNVCVSVLVKEI